VGHRVSATIGLGASEPELPRLVAFAERFTSRHGLPEAERTRLLIILEELFTNTVKYGYQDAVPVGCIEVALAVQAGTLRIDFSDDGRPFDPLNHAPPALDLPISERPIGGLGLHLLRTLVDHARYCRDGGRNRLVLMRKMAPSV
jgi:anti-sigma regulatory factor (Ser/Thr protein kinase)